MSEEILDSEKHYMQSPLVLWVDTFKADDGHPLEYRDLYDGVFLCDVMQQIDPRPAYNNVNRQIDDVSVRLHNWDILTRNIRGFYHDVLQQLLVMKLPNIGLICRDPTKDSSFAEIRKMLLLILGCAVQCEQKEMFIDKIMAMDINAQTQIVENIKEITDDTESILPIIRPDSPRTLHSYVDKILTHVHRLIRERDELSELASDMCQERDYYMLQAEGRPIINSPQISPDKHHLAVELAEVKAKLRHARQELEDRHEQLSDVKEELNEAISRCSLLKNENSSLLQEARVTRSLKDELDIAKEKASKIDSVEKEILKYKERLNELEFYKARTEELKEDNSILEETRAMLEDQLTASRKRVETVIELESELSRYRQQMDDLNKEREVDKEKIEYLTGENARLEFERKSSLNESASLESELNDAKTRIGNMGSSLSEQLSETSYSKILRLELENQRLTAKLGEIKETALIQSAEMNLELEKENQRLAKKVEKLHESQRDSSQQIIQAEADLSSAREEQQQIMKVMEAVKESSERQIRELEREKEQLEQTLDTIRERSEKTNDLKVKDLERENKRLLETLSVKNSEMSRLDFECRQLQRSAGELEVNLERVKDLEQETAILEKHNSELHQKTSLLEHSSLKVEQLEQENSDLLVENKKLERTVSSLKNSASRREQLEQEHITLTVEHQRLQRNLESFKAESDRLLELEAEKEDLTKELKTLQKSLEGQKTQKLKQEQLEFEVIDLSNEKQRLQKNLEVTTKRLQQLEKDNSDIELEIDKLNSDLDGLKITNKRLEERGKEANQLEVELNTLTRDKSTLDKENRKLKQTCELKEASLEDTTAKLSAACQENKSLRLTVERMKESSEKVKELDADNRELLHALNTDRKTLATLREDLVKEKIQSQELSNQLEQLTRELEKIGIHTEKESMSEKTQDANKFKALETMMKESLEKSLELKEEKIYALESRLSESKDRNHRLQEELRESKRKTEVLQQRIEEEEVAERSAAAAAGRERERHTRSNANNPTREIFELKDHLVQLERSNATLLAENENLRVNAAAMKDQYRKLEAQIHSIQSQNSSLLTQNSTLQERNAKLQVEYTTLQSQSSSALAQQDNLKDHVTRVEADKDSLRVKYDSLHNTHQSLLSNHESLQHLHEQLTSEYESLITEHSSLKQMHKSLKTELRDLQDQLDSHLQGKDDVNKIKDSLEKEREDLKQRIHDQGSLKDEHQRLFEKNVQIQTAYEKLSQDYTDVLASHKQIKTDYNMLQLKSTQQEGELTDAKEHLQVADVEFQKLENKMEAVYQINERLENENQALLLQIQQLLNQNHDLLTQALNSKDHFAEEEKAYLEKLSELGRQKERLEEKIMDHYKNRISPKKKGLGALIARKARGIISRAPKRSKSRNNLHDPNDNSSQESGSTEHVNEAFRRQALALSDDIFSFDKISILSAKSTEDLSQGGNGDMSSISGVNKPYQTKDFVFKGRGGRSSPGSEMLTLNQFLKETGKPSNLSDTPNIKDEPYARMRGDEESQSNESNNSSQMLSDNPYKPKNPKGALWSPTAQGVDNSQASSNSSTGFFSASSSEIFSSTPKSDHNSVRPRTPKSHESKDRFYKPEPNTVSERSPVDNRNEDSSTFSSINRLNQLTNPPSKTVNSSSSTRTPIAHVAPSFTSSFSKLQTSSSLSSTSQAQLRQSNSFTSRNLPSVPTDPPPPVPATERLDRLTMLGSSTTEQSHYATPSNIQGNRPFSSDKDVERNFSQNPHSIENSRRSLGSSDRPQRAFQNPSTIQTSSDQNKNFSNNSFDNTVFSGHNPYRPPTNNNQRARPASVMGSSGQVRGIISRHQTGDRPQKNQPAVRLMSRTGQKTLSNSQSNPQLIERPKSVPPQMFNRKDSVVDKIRESLNREAPVAPPRKMRDPKELVDESHRGSVSLLREPSRSSTRQPTSQQPSNSNQYRGDLRTFDDKRTFQSNQQLPQYQQQSQHHQQNYQHQQQSSAFVPSSTTESRPNNLALHPGQDHRNFAPSMQRSQSSLGQMTNLAVNVTSANAYPRRPSEPINSQDSRESRRGDNRSHMNYQTPDSYERYTGQNAQYPDYAERGRISQENRDHNDSLYSQETEVTKPLNNHSLSRSSSQGQYNKTSPISPNGLVSPHSNINSSPSHPQPTQSVQPQIRSQGKSYSHSNSLNMHRPQMGATSSEQVASALPSKPDVAGSQNRGSGDGGEPPKPTNSIWRTRLS